MPQSDSTRRVEKRTAPLFLRRPLLNGAEFIAWAKDQGFETTLAPDDLHVTIAYSKEPTTWPESLDDEVVVEGILGRSVQPLGDNGAVVLRFNSPELEGRWRELLYAGASWDHDGFTPHVTITWNGGDADFKSIKPFEGEMVFGPEKMSRVNAEWSPSDVTEKFYKAQVAKVDDELGLVFGWAIVCKVDGEDFLDSQNDHIPEESMLKAAVDFMENSRVAKEMHDGEQVGEFVFAFPLTEETAAAMDITTKFTGLMVAMKPADPAILTKFKDGTYTGFSIGGSRVEDEDVA